MRIAWVQLALGLLLVSANVAATCTLPPALDLRRAEYRIEKISASLKVALEFPKLSTLECTGEKVDFGTIWRVPLDAAHPVIVKVTDLNQTLVQTYTLTGEVELKVTASWAAWRFFNAVPSKKILDHRLITLDLFGSLATSPAVAVEDQGQRRSFPAQVQVW